MKIRELAGRGGCAPNKYQTANLDNNNAIDPRGAVLAGRVKQTA